MITVKRSTFLERKEPCKKECPKRRFYSPKESKKGQVKLLIQKVPNKRSTLKKKSTAMFFKFIFKGTI
jgi:hypothetical protein